MADGSTGRMPIVTDVLVASFVSLLECWPLGDAAVAPGLPDWLPQAWEGDIIGPPAIVRRPLVPSPPPSYD